jgi:hypothetical protein
MPSGKFCQNLLALLANSAQQKGTIMPLLKSPETPIAKRKYYIRLADPLAQAMERYAEFISASSVEHVITQALELVFRKDAEFRAWLEKNPSSKKVQPVTKEPL